MFAGTNIRVELAEKVRAIGVWGIALVHQLAREVGLVGAIDRRVDVLNIHRPYHEWDHVLNLAYSALCDGTPVVPSPVPTLNQCAMFTLRQAAPKAAHGFGGVGRLSPNSAQRTFS